MVLLHIVFKFICALRLIRVRKCEGEVHVQAAALESVRIRRRVDSYMVLRAGSRPSTGPLQALLRKQLVWRSTHVLSNCVLRVVAICHL